MVFFFLTVVFIVGSVVRSLLFVLCCSFCVVRSLLFVHCCSFIVVRSLLLSFSEINRHCSSMLFSQTQQTPTPTQKEYYQHSHLLSTAASSLCGSSQPPPRHFTATLLNSREVSQIMHILFHQPLTVFWDNTGKIMVGVVLLVELVDLMARMCFAGSCYLFDRVTCWTLFTC